ncbi:MAG: ATP-binding protein [Acidobacteriaceae bacterium]
MSNSQYNQLVAIIPQSGKSSFEGSIERTDSSQRRNAVIVLGVMIVLLFGALFSQAAFNLKFLQPDSNQQTYVFAGLSAVIFLLFVALTFVLIRNLLKLYAEAKGGVMGSRFRTKMVTGALLLSITPIIFLFFFAYSLMGHSIDKWFSRPVEELRQDSLSIATLLQNYAVQNAKAEASSLADSPEAKRAFETDNFTPLKSEMRKHDATLQGGFAIALKNDEVVATYHAPAAWNELRATLRTHTGQGTTLQTLKSPDGRDYFFAQAPEPKYVGGAAAIVVGIPIPAEFFATVSKSEVSQQRYYELWKSRKQVRQFYMMLLSLITAAVLFAATWLSMFISRLVTRPVAALATAAQELSRGNLDYRIEYESGDELGELIHRFNHMAEEIQANRKQLEASRNEIEQRRTQIETILESIPTGVLSVDEGGRVALLNGAFTRMFGTSGGVQIGGLWTSAFTAGTITEIKRLMRRADRMGVAGAQLEIERDRNKDGEPEKFQDLDRERYRDKDKEAVDVALTVASLSNSGARYSGGHVIVFEDFSDLLKAQKQAAWQEVARRVAHEIKNPLTPISLSAERINRYLDRGALDATATGVVRNCASAISANVETVRRLVNEFSSMAQFPAPRPVETDVNTVVKSALAMFDGRLAGIRLRLRLDANLPLVLADAEGLKRVVANLVDNAAEAMTDSLMKELTVSSALLTGKVMDAVEIAVADTGTGITPEIKQKLFLPYFSTKNRGTGLGLAIVSRIVEEHQGSVRVEENLPAGARFIVELPVAAGVYSLP